MTTPRPPADLATRTPRRITLPEGTRLHRFHPAGLGALYFDRSREGRFNAPDGSYGVLYVARERAGAFAETFLRSPGARLIDPGLMRRKAYVCFEVLRPLTLIEFTGPGLAVVGATAEVSHRGLPYDVPQAWSKALRDHPVKADGLAYTARHDETAQCHALFDQASGALGVCAAEATLDVDWFWQLAEDYGLACPPPQPSARPRGPRGRNVRKSHRLRQPHGLR
ncbi:RES family NAD+ phosphorylase [Pararhodospirillum oryzae]|uniref:RES domain-containing protein n=1 Tax=Pararhodospirillum oryzae TaxID=478448 RepID=A0A512H7L8_9PROT|nr:RES family NAD+ phosphorylase [Pararhodospirillum oryzae]GEO81449.1 hypothetical protein ROR02_15800 [Pararhodospirillum oryzae]